MGTRADLLAIAGCGCVVGGAGGSLQVPAGQVAVPSSDGESRVREGCVRESAARGARGRALASKKSPPSSSASARFTSAIIAFSSGLVLPASIAALLLASRSALARAISSFLACKMTGSVGSGGLI